MIKINLFFADLHCGSSVGLIKAEPWILEDGGTYSPSAGQRILWKQLVKSIQRFSSEISGIKKASKHRPKLIINFVGDLREGMHHDNVQVTTMRENEQQRIATDCIDYILNQLDFQPKYDALFFYDGTCSHSSGSAEEDIARDFIGSVPFIKPSIGKRRDGKYCWPRQKYSCNKQIFDIKHKGVSPGGRVHTLDNMLYNYIKDRYVREKMAGNAITNWWIRAHRHKYVTACHETPEATIHGILLPALQLRTHYANGLPNDMLATLGAFAVIVNDDGSTKHFAECMDFNEDEVNTV